MVAVSCCAAAAVTVVRLHCRAYCLGCCVADSCSCIARMTMSAHAHVRMQKLGMLPYVMGYRAGFKSATSADGPGGKGYDAAYRTGMQVRVYVILCVCVCACVYVCEYVCMCMCVLSRIFCAVWQNAHYKYAVCVDSASPPGSLYHTHTQTHTHVQTCTYTHNMHTCTQTHTHTHAHTNTHTHTHTHTQTHTHTHTHTLTHTHTRKDTYTHTHIPMHKSPRHTLT